MSNSSGEQQPTLKDLLAAYDAKQRKGDEDSYNRAKVALDAGKGSEVTNSDFIRMLRHLRSEAERGEQE